MGPFVCERLAGQHTSDSWWHFAAISACAGEKTYGKRLAVISAELVSHWYEAIVRHTGGVVIDWPSLARAS